MEILVNKIAESPNATISAISVDGAFICFVLEDGFRKVKQPGETRIQGGRYPIVARKHGKFYEQYKRQHNFKFVPQVWNVPEFQDILIHIGNKVTDTRGCLLVGLVANTAKVPWEIEQSTKAMLLLYSIIEKAFDKNENVFITIKR